jgi:hypothetical protein
LDCHSRYPSFNRSDLERSSATQTTLWVSTRNVKISAMNSVALRHQGFARIRRKSDIERVHVRPSPEAASSRALNELRTTLPGISRHRVTPLPEIWINSLTRRSASGPRADSHPWTLAHGTRVFLADRCFTFDARHDRPRIGRIGIAKGREAADVAISTAFGSARLARFKVITEELKHESKLLQLKRAA